MAKKPLASFVLLLAGLPVAALQAQGGEPSRAPLPDARSFAVQRVPIHTAPDDPIGGAYGTLAAGATYKVSFEGDMTFVPVLGADYPHNQPLSWRTTSFRSTPPRASSKCWRWRTRRRNG